MFCVGRWKKGRGREMGRCKDGCVCGRHREGKPFDASLTYDERKRAHETEEQREHRLARGKEYYSANRDWFKERSKEYHHKNRDAVLAKNKIRYHSNPEHYREVGKRWRLENAEAKRESDRRSRLKHIDKARKRDREYRLENLEKVKAYAEWYRNQPENQKKKKEYATNYYKTNKEQFKEKGRQYRENNLEKVRASENLKNRRRKAVESDGHTQKELHDYWRAIGIDPKRCTYCDAWHTKWENNWKTSAGDHVIPLIKGGKDFLENIVPCCSSCNGSKSAKILYEEWTPPNMRLRNVS